MSRDAATVMPLSAEQMERFDRDGYLVVDRLFSDEELAPLIDEICAEVDVRARHLHAQGVITDLCEGEPFESRLARLNDQTPVLARQIWNGILNGPAVFDVIGHPRLLNVAEQMCGPELIASAVYRLRPKVPSHELSAVPWHQDAGYTEPYCDDSNMLTVWLALVDADEHNGCMWVMPGVHKHGIRRHAKSPETWYLTIPDEELPSDVEPVCVPVAKGGVLLLTNMTPHASFANRTDAVRWSMDLRYQDAALPTNADITRLPDEMISPDAPSACYPPEADFLVRSRRRPEEVITDPRRFHEIRTRHQATPVTQRWSDMFDEW